MDDDDFDRFVLAQDTVYDTVVEELRQGRKRSHWMWFIFPQLRGLGHSETARFYGLRGLEDAVRYGHDPLLGLRLRECAGLVLALDGRSAHEIFGSPDDLKLGSSMTLFDLAFPQAEGDVYRQVLHTHFAGQRDGATLRLLGLPG